MTALLDLDGIAAGYGPAEVLHGVSFALAEGEILALMGRNGMGKTTTIRCILRMLVPTAGEVRFDGRSLSGLPSHAVARRGIGLVPEGRRCFAPLTVAENLTAAARRGPWNLAEVVGLFPRLGERMGQRAAALSGGEQQMLAIGRALMTNPRLLVLDEATEGLAPVVRQEIAAAIRALTRDGGLSILIVDKSLDELRRLADRAVILEKGRVAWNGALPELDADTATRLLGV